MVQNLILILLQQILHNFLIREPNEVPDYFRFGLLYFAVPDGYFVLDPRILFLQRKRCSSLDLYIPESSIYRVFADMRSAGG